MHICFSYVCVCVCGWVNVGVGGWVIVRVCVCALRLDGTSNISQTNKSDISQTNGHSLVTQRQEPLQRLGDKKTSQTETSLSGVGTKY